MRNLFLAFAVSCIGAGACAYNPPPEVTLVGPANKHFVAGEPIVLMFSEPVQADSLEILVWPGQKDLYDVEGQRLPGVEPILDSCTLAKSPCGSPETVSLSLSADRTQLEMAVETGALGPLAQPLVLEITGKLADDDGHAKNVSRLFDFQVVEGIWDPYADVVEEDGTGDVQQEPVEVVEGPHLFFTEFTTPIKLPQQYFADLEVNEETGEYVFLLVDADPIPGAPVNTKIPEELTIDIGDEGFMFASRGQINWDEDQELVFNADAFTLSQTIGPITFELRDMVMSGRIEVDPESGRSRWDGTIAVKDVYYEVGGQETIYPSDQANFEIVQLLEGEIPDNNPVLCNPEPCQLVGGKCDLFPGETWPPESVCE